MKKINVDEIVTNTFNLISFICCKYNIKTYDDFKCPLTKALAESIDFFERIKQNGISLK